MNTLMVPAFSSPSLEGRGHVKPEVKAQTSADASRVGLMMEAEQRRGCKEW